MWDSVILCVVHPVTQAVCQSDVAENELPSVLLQDRIVIHRRSPVGRRVRFLLEVFAPLGTEAFVHRADELGDVAALAAVMRMPRCPSSRSWSATESPTPVLSAAARCRTKDPGRFVTLFVGPMGSPVGPF